jgi:glutamine amidotransferase
MDVYEATGLAEFVKNAAGIGQPIIGICLGMQLLTQRSEESIGRKGLCLIPGETVRISDSRWHIGWNTLKTSSNNDFLKSEMGNYFYFNHGFRYQGDSKFCMSVAEYIEDIPAIVRYGNLVGLQFHPEKSQDAGRYLLRNCIADLMDAK